MPNSLLAFFPPNYRVKQADDYHTELRPELWEQTFAFKNKKKKKM